MLKSLKNKNVFKSSKVLGVHCIIQPNGDKTYTYVLISMKRKQVEIEKYGIADQLSETSFMDFPSTIPICLSIDGKGVLIKKIVVDPATTFLNQVIPNANENDFFYESFDGDANTVFVSVARKNFVLDIVRLFTDQKRAVIDLTLGPLKASKIVTLFDHPPQALVIPSYQIQYDDITSTIKNYTKLEAEGWSGELTYRIGSTELPCAFVLPYYHALTYYLHDRTDTHFTEISLLKDEFISKRMFITLGIFSLALLFIISVTNMAFYVRFSENKQLLENKISGNEELLANLKKLKVELAWKEKFLSQAGILRNSRLSYYADQIAACVPGEISLEKMELHPIISKVQKQKEVELQPDQILIEGFTKDSSELNDWAHILKKLSWVKDVTVTNYLKDNNGTIGSFSVLILLNN
jgi:Tfp pilus assembly protein PilN